MGFYRSMPVDISPLPPTTNGYYYSGKKIETKVDVTLIPFTINSYMNSYNVEGLNVVHGQPSSINANCTNITLDGPSVYFDNTNTNRPQLIVNSRIHNIYLSDSSNLFSRCNNMTDWSCLEYLNTEYCTNFRNMFFYCTNFNQSVNISDIAVNCENMFSSCTNLNQPVTIGNNVTNCADMFHGCYNFNQHITIPNSVINCRCMFDFCRNFNQPVVIPNSVNDCSAMFIYCYNFNQSVTIPDSVSICTEMFFDCVNLNCDIYVSCRTDTNCRDMFRNCHAISNIYFKGNTASNLFVAGLLYNRSNAKRVNVFFNSVFNNKFNITSGITIVGTGKSVTWTPMTNGFYNATYNVYCYYNYAG